MTHNYILILNISQRMKPYHTMNAEEERKKFVFNNKGSVLFLVYHIPHLLDLPSIWVERI